MTHSDHHVVGARLGDLRQTARTGVGAQAERAEWGDGPDGRLCEEHRVSKGEEEMV